MEKKLSGEELVALVSGGGWEVVGGRAIPRKENGYFPPASPVVQALLLGGALRVATGVGTFDLSSDNIVVVEDWMIEVRCTFMRRQQRKKVDGGGFVDVPTVGVALRLSNPKLEKAAKMAREVEAQRNKKVRQRSEKRRYVKKSDKFEAELAEKYVGKKLVGIELYYGGLRLRFENGPELTIELNDDALSGYHMDEVWNDVNGISLDTFKASGRTHDGE